MEMEINGGHEREKQFFLILILGIVDTLRCNAISITEAWNWILNLRMLNFAEEYFGQFSDITNAIHLGTELENVERIIPEKYEDSYNEISSLCIRALCELSCEVQDNNYHLIIKSSSSSTSGTAPTSRRS
jgi:hypothetical protein